MNRYYYSFQNISSVEKNPNTHQSSIGREVKHVYKHSSTIKSYRLRQHYDEAQKCVNPICQTVPELYER